MMRIKLEKYNSSWQEMFEGLKRELIELIGFANPKVEHIGSTAVKGLSAKPIIDILVGIPNIYSLDQTVKPLIEKDYIYYEFFNDIMPYRRFFVKHKHKNFQIPNIIKLHLEAPSSTLEHDNRIAHIHIIYINSEHYKRHIAFRDYLNAHPFIRNEYEKLKESLSLKDWDDGNHYNQAKNEFIKSEELKALRWFDNINSDCTTFKER